MGLLEKKVTPDVEGLLSVIRRTAVPKRVYNIELFLDDEIKDQACQYFGLDKDIDKNSPFASLQRDIILHSFLGYDVFRVSLIKGKQVFMFNRLLAADTTSVEGQKRPEREWCDEHSGPIQNWEDFENYRWPDKSEIDLSALEWLEKNLPANMGVFDLTAHILEVTTWLLGYETMCMKMYDAPDLIDAIFKKVGQFYVDYTKVMCDFSCMKLIWGSDDMGFRTSTLFSPDFLRQKVFPWHKRCAAISHANGRPYLLHCCGQGKEIMDDLIDDVGIDAKHSFEDVILPVSEAKTLYGQKIALLGGIDMDFLCRADHETIRKRVRATLEVCMANGGYCLGSGNTVANYIPLENYLVMLDEGRRFEC